MATGIGSLDSLSVEAIAAEKGGFDKAKLQAQASNNVARQQFAKAIRGDAPAASSKPPPAPKKVEKPQKTAEEEQLEIANYIQKVTEFKRNPFLAQKVASVAMPRNGTLAEWKVAYKQCKDALGQGVGEMSLRQGYCMLMPVLCNFLSSDMVPPKIRLPPGGDQFMNQIICHPEPEKRAFNEEFAELAIEYAHLFRTGPIPRLIFGTMTALFSYKQLVESGVIESGRMPEQQPQQQQPEPQEQQRPLHPAPMKIYPEPVQTTSGDSVFMPAASSTMDPPPGYPTSSSSEYTPIKIEPAKKPARGGKRGI